MPCLPERAFCRAHWETPRLDVTRSFQQASKLASDVIKQARSRRPRAVTPVLQPDRGQLTPALSTRPALDFVGWGSCWWIGSTAAVKSRQSCPTLCDPMDCSPPGSSVHGILQARAPEWAATAFSIGSAVPLPSVKCHPGASEGLY